MLDKLIAFFKLPVEYGKIEKVIWNGDELEIINYGFLVSYTENQIFFDSLKVIGKGLKLLYQDPNVVRISGKIQEIKKGDL